MIISIFLILFSVVWLFAVKRLNNKHFQTTGLIEVSNLKDFKFYPLVATFENLEQWANKNLIKIKNNKTWSRVLLSAQDNVISLEDKNYKAQCFKNRRRFRKIPLKDGDVIDIEGQTYIYSDNNATNKIQRRQLKQTPVINNENKNEQLYNIPMLKPLDNKLKSFYLDKNITYIGRSNSNDLVLRSPQIAMHQAFIKLEYGRAKLVSLANDGTNFVNGKRAEEYFLNNKDEIAFNSIKYKFLIQKSPVKI